MFEPPLAVLDMLALEDASVFDRPDEYRPFVLPEFRGTLRYLPDLEQIELRGSSAAGEQSLVIQLAYATLRFGRRVFLICPSCSKSCLTIVCTEDSVVCKQCFRNFPGSSSKARRSYLIMQAEGKLSDYRRGVRRARPKVATPRRKPLVSSKSSIGTEEGLRLGRGAAQYDIFFEYLKKSPADLQNHENDFFVWPCAPSLITRHPVLDVRVLARQGSVIPSIATAQTLGWPPETTGNRTLLVIVDYRDDEPFMMVSHSGIDPLDPSWQRIDMALRNGDRVRFICPVTGERADILYLRNAMFASRKAQRLYHPYQRASDMP